MRRGGGEGRISEFGKGKRDAREGVTGNGDIKTITYFIDMLRRRVGSLELGGRRMARCARRGVVWVSHRGRSMGSRFVRFGAR